MRRLKIIVVKKHQLNMVAASILTKKCFNRKLQADNDDTMVSSVNDGDNDSLILGNHPGMSSAQVL